MSHSDQAAAQKGFKQALVICDQLGEGLNRAFIALNLTTTKGSGD
jgi:hypothetical protein